MIGQGHRGTGQAKDDDHAEKRAFTCVQEENFHLLPHSTLFTTLEPCTPLVRSIPHECCTKLIKQHQVKKVWVGVLDPNQGVCGKGVLELQEGGIEVELFPHSLAQRIRLANRKFNAAQQSLGMRFTEPANGSTIRTWDTDGNFTFRGECLNPPGPDVYVLVKKNRRYYLQKQQPTQGTDSTKWQVTANFGTYGLHTVYVVKANEIGTAFLHYYRQVLDTNIDRKEKLKSHYKLKEDEWIELARELRLPGAEIGIERSQLPKGLDIQAEIEVDVETPPKG
jgi:pyrimidine deaminase RibD-like protein